MPHHEVLVDWNEPLLNDGGVGVTKKVESEAQTLKDLEEKEIPFDNVMLYRHQAIAMLQQEYLERDDGISNLEFGGRKTPSAYSQQVAEEALLLWGGGQNAPDAYIAEQCMFFLEFGKLMLVTNNLSLEEFVVRDVGLQAINRGSGAELDLTCGGVQLLDHPVVAVAPQPEKPTSGKQGIASPSGPSTVYSSASSASGGNPSDARSMAVDNIGMGDHPRLKHTQSSLFDDVASSGPIKPFSKEAEYVFIITLVPAAEKTTTHHAPRSRLPPLPLCQGAAPA